MWNTRRLSKSNRGFTLIELICGLCIGSIVIGICLSILSFSSKSNSFADGADEILYSGNYTMEFIKYEMQNLDKIIPCHMIKDLNELYPNNIGFVGMEYKEGNKCTYFTYYIKNNTLTRLAREIDRDVIMVGGSFSGYNDLCEYVESFGETSIDWDNKILYLDIKLSHNSRVNSFKSTILLNCSLDY